MPYWFLDSQQVNVGLIAGTAILRRKRQDLRLIRKTATLRSHQGIVPNGFESGHTVLQATLATLKFFKEGRFVMAYIFTPEFLQSIDDSTNAFERNDIARIALLEGDNPKQYRELLESYIAQYPVDKRDPLIELIRSPSDIESKAARAELIVFGLLISLYKKVDVEPAIKDIFSLPEELTEFGQKTPDFIADNKVVFEVASIFEAPDPIEQSIIETINTIDGGTHIFNLRIVNHLPDKNPRLSKIKDLVSAQLEKHTGEPLEPFVLNSPEGIVISGYMYTGDPSHATVGGTISSYGFSDNEKEYVNAIRNNPISKKIRKYRFLSKIRIPHVLVIYNYNDWLDPEDFDDIFFGDKEYHVSLSANSIDSVTRRNSILQPQKNTSLSAVLIRNYRTRDGFYLLENPWAEVHLGDHLSDIRKAFKTKPLLPVSE